VPEVVDEAVEVGEPVRVVVDVSLIVGVGEAVSEFVEVGEPVRVVVDVNDVVGVFVAVRVVVDEGVAVRVFVVEGVGVAEGGHPMHCAAVLRQPLPPHLLLEEPHLHVEPVE
jgi:hypothetical protein